MTCTCRNIRLRFTRFRFGETGLRPCTQSSTSPNYCGRETKQLPPCLGQHSLQNNPGMSILTNPLYRPLLEVLRSSRNGIVYGGKIRFSHALVINLLYRSGPLRPRLQQTFTAAADHAQVLAAFAIIYKTVVNILQHDKAMGRDNPGLAKFIAGGVGSWFVYSQHFGYFHPGITHQITLYCFSRVLVASAKILLDYYLNCTQPALRLHDKKVKFRDLTDKQQNKLRQSIYNKSWKYFAVLTWALVMLIYDFQPKYLQSSLRHSMAYIYDVEMESWSTWRDFFGI